VWHICTKSLTSTFCLSLHLSGELCLSLSFLFFSLYIFIYISIIPVLFLSCFYLKLRHGISALFDKICTDSWWEQIKCSKGSEPTNSSEHSFCLSIQSQEWPHFYCIFNFSLPSQSALLSPSPLCHFPNTSHLSSTPDQLLHHHLSSALTHDSHEGCEVTGIIELCGTCMLR